MSKEMDQSCFLPAFKNLKKRIKTAAGGEDRLLCRVLPVRSCVGSPPLADAAIHGRFSADGRRSLRFDPPISIKKWAPALLTPIGFLVEGASTWRKTASTLDLPSNLLM